MMLPLIAKLGQFTKLSGEDKAILESLTTQRIRRFESHQDIILEGDPPHTMNIVLSGWAYRYKQLEDGRRQIISLFLPGDFCDYNAFILREMDHSIGTLTPVVIAEVSREMLEAITLAHPRITQALWWETLVNFAIQREWTVNLGQRDAIERVPHLFCEVFIRLRGVGLTRGQTCDFPLTQAELGDATGLTSVHVNRTLQELRASNLIILRDKTLTVPNLGALMRVALFNPNYLHIQRDNSSDVNTVA
jgi:CRP-like cAMP-binding protein